ncbi:thioesterase domain-containing protein [Methylobacterium oryzihabitans]|uniref:Thioesterase TesA-like domain-containing protein n=1 Tax=Methylobacterium oryzihabitans TaxID=2499852 RepID=A0A437P0Y7_9HYPH|nr:thioesterase domain-containing protein [Methylobacterium oryzihabitans]RVU15959.1 hypothetical protein EOE48_18000 [Methylobacterium oryzihabitans]
MAQDIEKERLRGRRLEKLRFWRSACASESPVVTLHNGAPGAAPLIFFHGDWDNGGLYMAKLTAELGLPVVGLAPHLDPVPATVEAMAADRLAPLLAAQPEGPYRIGGFCNGATVAYEAARQLLAAGRTVEAVLLVAPPSLNAGRVFRTLVAVLGRLLRGTGPGATPAGRRRLGRAMTRLTALRRVLGYSLADLRTVVDRKRRLQRATRDRIGGGDSERALTETYARLKTAYEHAVYAYAPPPLPVRVVVFGTGRDGAGRRLAGYDVAYDGRYWSDLGPGVECVAVPGDHYTCIAEHAPALARAITTALDRRPDPAPAPAPLRPVLAGAETCP